MNSESAKPIDEIRPGAIKAAIWKNVVDLGNNSQPMYCVTFQRLYRDGQNKWHGADSFGRDDLLVLAKVADHVHSRVCKLQQSEKVRTSP